ncbi:MAG TPA: hypothetical protein VIK60_14950 [Vicinamibacterales bacterium]
MIALLFALVVWLPVSAQQRHVVDQATLDQVVADHVHQTADDREAILRVLEIEQVRKLAGEVGLDLKRAEAAVATLDNVELSVIAADARMVNDALVGGQSNVTISTTAIIIGLLVLILIIIAV